MLWASMVRRMVRRMEKVSKAMVLPLLLKIQRAKTDETPVGDALSMLIPGMPLVNMGMDAVGLGEYAPGTLLQDGAEAAWDFAGDAWDTTSSVAGDLWDGAGSLASSAGSAKPCSASQ